MFRTDPFTDPFMGWGWPWDQVTGGVIRIW